MSEVKSRKKAPVITKPPVSAAKDTVDADDDKKKQKIQDNYKDSLKTQRKTKVWARIVLILGAFVVGYFMKSNEKSFATVNEHLPLRMQKLECNIPNTIFPKCMPEECARLVSDNLVPSYDAGTIKEYALNYFKTAKKVKGPVNVFPLSTKTSFLHSFKSSDPTTTNAFVIFRLMVVNLIHLIEERFHVDKDTLHLTHPIFVSQITNNTPITMHDEYYQEHIDADTYSAFHYTALLYLSDYKKDFTGGRFIFNDQNKTKYTVEPKIGRVILFTSGSENTHHIEKVQNGTRYAMTIPFTCDKNFALDGGSLAKIWDVGQTK